MSTIHTSVNLNLEIKEEIERLAKEEHVSFNAKMNQLIELGLDKSGKKMSTPLVFAGFGYAATPGANITGAKRRVLGKTK